MRILLVDDEVRITKLLRMYFERESYQVDVADNGNDGLTKAMNENYDCIILDVLMPGKDGYEVLEELRKTKETPVIMLSAKYSDEDQKHGKDLGVTEYISKPFSPGAVVSKVKEIVS